ncbi:MAG: DUF1203 domain-containing protein [Caulobacteraceae bacterium]
MSFVVSGLSVETFRPLFGLSEAALAARGVLRRIVETRPGSPCRITLEDAQLGERVLLLNYEHQSADTPYRASHAIFVREAALETKVVEGEIPEVFRGRTLSLRAFDDGGMMVDAGLCQGDDAAPFIERLLTAPGAAYLHAHYAGRGCYAARIDPA